MWKSVWKTLTTNKMCETKIAIVRYLPTIYILIYKLMMYIGKFPLCGKRKNTKK